jgi:hypothetical protein
MVLIKIKEETKKNLKTGGVETYYKIIDYVCVRKEEAKFKPFFYKTF